jgi:hypothetical protein
VIQYRRIAALILGIWLGAGFFADFAVTRNFKTVETFLADPGDVTTSVELNRIGRWKERIILRRNAAEENNYLFEVWEWTELALGTVLLASLAFGERPQKLLLAAPLAMIVIVAAQRFYLSPQVAELGRKIADLPAKDPLNGTFWMFHGIYSGAEIVKILIGLALAVRPSVRGRKDPDYFVKQFAAGRTGSANAPGKAV